MDSERMKCPSCGAAKASLVARKYIVSSLRRCPQCSLLFRTPTTTPEENANFYQVNYRQGSASDMPDEEELQRLKASRFLGSGIDYTCYLKMLASLGAKPGDRILDFGCSWGYGSWQMKESGYQVTAYEISKPRCRYARERLEVEAYDDLEQMPDETFDIFFACHVFEHLPSVSKVFEYAWTKLRKGGLLVAFTPNGSDTLRRVQPQVWQKLWNRVHPNLLDDVFYRKTFPSAMLASTPYDYDEICRSRAEKKFQHPFALDGGELMVVVRSE